MTELPPADNPTHRTRRQLLRLAGIGVIALGAGSVLSYSDVSEEERFRFDAPGRAPIRDLRRGARVVYNTHRHEPVAAALRRYLRAYPGERVELVQLGPADAAQRVVEERDSPVADVWIHAHAADLIALADRGALRPFDSGEAARIPAQYRDERGRWYAVGLRPQVLAYNRRILQQANLQAPASVLDLTASTWRSNFLGRWRGEAVVGLPDPTRPSTQAWLASIFTALAKDEATKFLDTLRIQGAGITGSDSDTLNALAAESHAIAAVEAPEALARLAKGDTTLDVAYTEQDPKGRLPGAWMSPTVVTLTGGGAKARQLMDFLLSADAARGFVEEGFEFPARTDVAVPETHRARSRLRVAPQSVRDVLPAMDPVRESLRAWGV